MELIFLGEEEFLLPVTATIVVVMIEVARLVVVAVAVHYSTTTAITQKEVTLILIESLFLGMVCQIWWNVDHHSLFTKRKENIEGIGVGVSHHTSVFLFGRY